MRKYRWTQRRDAGALAHGQHLNRASLTAFYDETDTFVLHARLPPDVGALVKKALQIAGDIAARDRRNEARARKQTVARSRARSQAGTMGIMTDRSHAARRADALG